MQAKFLGAVLALALFAPFLFAQEFSTECESSSVVIPLQNPTSETVRYTLDVDFFHNLTTITPSEVFLLANEQQNITVTFTPPCEQTAIYSPSLLITQDDAVVVKVPLQFRAERTALFTVTTGEPSQEEDLVTNFQPGTPSTSCQGTTTRIPLFLSNDGNRQTTYTFTAIPESVTVARSQYTLVANQQAVNFLEIPASVEHAALLVTTGDTRLTIPFNLTTIDCVPVTLTNPEPACTCDTLHHDLTLTNALSNPLPVSITAFGTVTNITLNGTVTLTLNATCADHYSENIVVTVPSLGLQKKLKATGEVIGNEGCYGSVLSHRQFMFLTNSTAYVPLTITNLGKSDQTYQLHLSGDWATAESTSFSIRPGQSYTTTLTVNSPREGVNGLALTASFPPLQEQSTIYFFTIGPWTIRSLLIFTGIILLAGIVTTIVYGKKRNVLIKKNIITWLCMGIALVLSITALFYPYLWLQLPGLLVLGFIIGIPLGRYLLLLGLIFSFIAAGIFTGIILLAGNDSFLFYQWHFWSALGGFVSGQILAYFWKPLRTFILEDDIELAESREQD